MHIKFIGIGQFASLDFGCGLINFRGCGLSLGVVRKALILGDATLKKA